MPAVDERITLKAAAAILGQSSTTLRVQAWKGKLSAVKVGRDLFVTPSEVERYRIESRGQRKGAKKRAARGGG